MRSDISPLIISLGTIMDDFNGQLNTACKAHDNPDHILVNWPGEVEVKNQGIQHFFVTVAVSFAEGGEDELADIASQLCPEKHHPLFAFIPGYAYGRKDFGVFIAESGQGENLVNGLINEVVQQAGIEAAVTRA